MQYNVKAFLIGSMTLTVTQCGVLSHDVPEVI